MVREVFLVTHSDCTFPVARWDWRLLGGQPLAVVLPPLAVAFLPLAAVLPPLAVVPLPEHSLQQFSGEH